MDAQTRKAMFRAKLKESAQKRIDSPLVRYNELDQPVCKVCNVVIKSESLWSTHLTTSKHKKAVEDIKARAAKSTSINSLKPTQSGGADIEIQPSSSPPAQARPASSLPTDFFDQPDAKRQNQGSTYTGDSMTNNKISGMTASRQDKITGTTASLQDTSYSAPSAKDLKKKTSELVPSKITDVPTKEKKHLSDTLDMKGKENINSSSVLPLHTSNLGEELEGNQVKGSLPEGFFDNKDADLRARGLEPVKYDIKDEWKEFQKTIQDDLQEVDYRLEEEEFDAAEVREEMELIEQRSYVERVEMMKRKQQEISMAKTSAQVKSPSYMGAESSDVSSSDGDDDEDNYLIDWRAKRF